MESIQLNPKRMSVQIQRLLMMMIAIMVASMAITACLEEGNGDENDIIDDGGANTAQSVNYSGTKDGTSYTLTITEDIRTRAYTGKAGDNYTLTASSKTSSGSVTSINGTVYTLKPSNSSTTFSATVSENSLSGLSGTITWKDNSSSQAPGSFTDGGGTTATGKVWLDKKGGATVSYAKLDDVFLPIKMSGPGEYTIRIGENQHITSFSNDFFQKGLIVTIKAESGNVEITRDYDLFHHFLVADESTLIIEKGIILKGGGDVYNFDEDCGIALDHGGKCIMNEGVKLTNFSRAAVMLFRDGLFEMNGGTICDNIRWGLK